MKTVYIHIGAHKTGTTAIQSFLSSNRTHLLQKGYLYPDSGKFNAHHFIPHGFQNNTSFYRNPNEMTKKLIDDICHSDLNKIIISSEDLELLTHEKIILLKRLFPDDCSVKIIFYARRQDTNIESRYNQRVKTKVDKTFTEFLGDGSFPLLDYYQTLAMWKDIFGKENIIVRCYEKEQMPNGIFHDFVSAIGLEWDEKYLVPQERINPSLNWDLIEIIRLCNTRFKSDKKFHKYLLNNLKMVNLGQIEKNRSLLSPKQRLEIIHLYAESNEKVAREYLGRDDGRLFFEPPPDPSEPWEPYEGLSVEKCVPIFTQMLFNMDTKLRKEVKKSRQQTVIGKGKTILEYLSAIKQKILGRLKS